MATPAERLADSLDISRMLLEGGHSTIAGRLAGAFRNIHRKFGIAGAGGEAGCRYLV